MMFPLVLLALSPLFAPDAGSDRLRELLKAAPELPVERVELKVTPPVTFEKISAITADKNGNIYVIHRPQNGDPIVVLDPQGKFIRSWGKGMFELPHGIRIDPQGNVWTADAHTSVIYKFTPEGKRLLEISVGDIPAELPPNRNRTFCGATDIGFAKGGNIFVTDGYCNSHVIEYDAAGKQLRMWGDHGTGPGEFEVVHSVAIGPDGVVYIADRENGRLQWFSQTGKFLGERTYGGQFFSIAFGPKGEFYAAVHPKDAPLTSEFNVIRIDLASGKILGKFEVPAHEIAVGPDGTLLPGTLNGQLVVLKPR